MKRSPDEDVTGDVSLNRWWGGRTAEKKGVLRWTEGHTKVKLSCFAILLKAKGTRALARWVDGYPCAQQGITTSPGHGWSQPRCSAPHPQHQDQFSFYNVSQRLLDAWLITPALSTQSFSKVLSKEHASLRSICVWDKCSCLQHTVVQSLGWGSGSSALDPNPFGCLNLGKVVSSLIK